MPVIWVYRKQKDLTDVSDQIKGCQKVLLTIDKGGDGKLTGDWHLEKKLTIKATGKTKIVFRSHGANGMIASIYPASNVAQWLIEHTEGVRENLTDIIFLVCSAGKGLATLKDAPGKISVWGPNGILHDTGAKVQVAVKVAGGGERRAASFSLKDAIANPAGHFTGENCWTKGVAALA